MAAPQLYAESLADMEARADHLSEIKISEARGEWSCFLSKHCCYVIVCSRAKNDILHIGGGKHVKKGICIAAVLLMAGFCVGCEKEEAESSTESGYVQEEAELSVENQDSQEEAHPSVNTNEEDVIDLKETIRLDFDYDFTADIEDDVDCVVSASSTLQNELKNMDRITQKYTLLLDTAQTQQEMNTAARWLYVVWDTELNDLWSRFCDFADEETEEKVRAEQRKWIAMKDEVTLRGLGTPEENGSMHPLLLHSFWEENTKNRAYYLANELAKVKGEPFVMPELSKKYGSFVDNQGTDHVYSSLFTDQSVSGKDEAKISIDRQGEVRGGFIDHGNGELAFLSDDGSVEGIIKINGWDGATFEVTKTTDVSPFAVGERAEFPFVF